jgi:hypothetical protein
MLAEELDDSREQYLAMHLDAMKVLSLVDELAGL